MHQSQSLGAMPRIQPTVSRGATVNCFRCGEPGHFQQNCTNVSRRRTPYSGREFQINVAPPASSSEQGNQQSHQNQDLRSTLSSVANRNQQSSESSANVDSLKSEQSPASETPTLPCASSSDSSTVSGSTVTAA